MRKKFDKRLDQKFKEAYKMYLAGNWARAEDLLGAC